MKKTSVSDARAASVGDRSCATVGITGHATLAQSVLYHTDGDGGPAVYNDSKVLAFSTGPVSVFRFQRAAC